MKHLFTFLFALISLIAGIALSASKYAVASGNWNLTTTWSATRGGASGASAPSATDTVWIPSGFMVTVEASGKSCYNLIVENGGVLVADQINPNTNQRYIRVSGDSVVNNGVIGYNPATPGTLTAICFESFVASKTVTFKGSGISKISRIRNGNNISNTTVVIDQDMTFTYTGSTGTGGVCWYGAQGTGTGHTFKVNAGRTVNFLDYGYVGSNSSVDTDGPNTTIQVDGNLLMSGTNCTLSLRPATGATVSLIVNGTVEVGRTLKPAGTTGVPSVITVNGGGILKVGTAGGGVTYFDVPAQTVTGAGTFQFTGGTMQIAATAGLDPTSGPIRTTTRNFDTGASYSYVGTAAQVTGSDLPATVNNLALNNAAGVTISNPVAVTGNLTLGGNNSYTTLGNVTGYTGVTYAATVAQTTGAELPSSITNLTINNANGVTLGGNTTVSGALTLTGGTLTLGANNLTIGSSGSISGASSTTYVVTDGAGVLSRNGVGASDVFFPVGPATTYNPVTINNAGTVDDFSVSVKGTFDTAPNDPTSCLTRQWTLSEATPGGSNATVTFQFNASDPKGGLFDPAQPTMYIGRFPVGGPWLSTLATKGGSDPYTVSATFTAFSPFAVTTDASALPIQLSSFTGTVLNNRVRLNWSTASELNNYGFYVQKRTAGTTEWNELANSFIAGHGTTNQPQHYTFTDNSPFTGSVQYRLKQVDLDGATHFTDPIEIDNPTSVKELAPIEFSLKQNYPNPFNPSTEIKFSVEKTDHAALTVYNTLGQTVAILFDDVAEAGHYYKVRLEGANLASGIYFYRLATNSKNQLRKMILMK